MEACRGLELGLNLFLTCEVNAHPAAVRIELEQNISVCDVEF
jgi:hypothetical protein